MEKGSIYTSQGISFEVLRGGVDSNYSTWKPYASICLRSVLAWKIVTGEEDRPKPPLDDKPESTAYRHYERVMSSYQKRADRACTIIMASTSRELHPVIDGHIENPREMWNALKEHLNSGDPAHATMALLHNLFYLAPVAGEPIGNYLNEVPQIRNDMAEMELEAFIDNVIKIVITRSLPEQYSSQTHYMNDQKPRATLEQFNASLLQFESQNAMRQLAHPAAVQAHKVTTSPQPSTSTSTITLSRPHCIGCGKPGHWMVDCRRLPVGSNPAIAAPKRRRK
jgi:hypothetical protein